MNTVLSTVTRYLTGLVLGFFLGYYTFEYFSLDNIATSFIIQSPIDSESSFVSPSMTDPNVDSLDSTSDSLDESLVEDSDAVLLLEE